MASYLARFECAICQGTATHPEFCALTCGHCFHVNCIHAWLAKGSNSCPSCRAPASKRSLRLLVGVETVEDTSLLGDAPAAAPPPPPGGGSGCDGCRASAALLQQLQAQQQQVVDLTLKLSEVEQRAAELDVDVEQLGQQQHALQHKLKAARVTNADLEGGRLQDAQRLTAASEELSQLRERYLTDTVRMKRQLHDEQLRAKRAEADLRRLQLQNPSLCLAAIQNILPGEDEQQTQLSSVLAQRNQQLQQAQARIAQLQGQLQHQQRAAEAEVEAASSRHKAAEVKAARDKEDALKAVLRLECDNSRLEHENTQLAQQLQELQQVLLALQGGPAGRDPRQPQPLQRQRAHRPAVPMAGQQQQQQQQPSSRHERHENEAAWLEAAELVVPPHDQEEQQEPWHLDVAAAVGPGSMLRQPLATSNAPSFFKQQRGTPAGGVNRSGSVSGLLLRHGPDGRGNTAKHLAAAPAAKRASGVEAPHASKKKARAPSAPSGCTSIKSYFAGARGGRS